MMNRPMIMTGIPDTSDCRAGTALIRLKKSTDLPTTIASMNIAMPMGSFKAISMSSMVHETAMEALPYSMPSVFDSPRFNTSHGPAPIFA